MSDPVDAAKNMLRTIEFAMAKGIAQAYPDSTIHNVLGNLVAEAERLRSDLAEVVSRSIERREP